MVLPWLRKPKVFNNQSIHIKFITSLFNPTTDMKNKILLLALCAISMFSYAQSPLSIEEVIYKADGTVEHITSKSSTAINQDVTVFATLDCDGGVTDTEGVPHLVKMEEGTNLWRVNHVEFKCRKSLFFVAPGQYLFTGLKLKTDEVCIITIEDASGRVTKNETISYYNQKKRILELPRQGMLYFLIKKVSEKKMSNGSLLAEGQ
jgi:hypothetical protein